MPTPEEIQRGHLERDRLLQVNRFFSDRPSTVVIQAPSGLKERAHAIAERGHREHGCFAPEAWCPFCELLSIT